MFDKLHVTVTDAELWHIFDSKIRKDERRAIGLVSLCILGTFIYLPVCIAVIVTAYMDDNPLWVYVAVITALAAYFNVQNWQTEHYNVFLARYLKRPNAQRDIMEIIAADNPIMDVVLRSEKSRFIRGYIERNTLRLEFDEAGIPHTVDILDYSSVQTEDICKQGVIVVASEGITCYRKPERSVSAW